LFHEASQIFSMDDITAVRLTAKCVEERADLT